MPVLTQCLWGLVTWPARVAWRMTGGNKRYATRRESSLREIRERQQARFEQSRRATSGAGRDARSARETGRSAEESRGSGRRLGGGTGEVFRLGKKHE